MKMNFSYLYFIAFIPIVFSCSSGPANDPRTIYTYQTMQTEMLITCERIYENMSNIKEISEDKSEPDIQVRAKQSMKDIQKMEVSAGDAIALIEDAKRLLFLQMGENLDIKDASAIRYEKFDIRYPLSPVKYDLSKVKNNETTDVLSPSGAFAKKIQTKIKHLRKVLTETIAFNKDRYTHEIHNYFKDPNINTFSSRLNLRKQIEQSNGFKHVSMDDQELILRIYERISYTQEFWESSFGENLTWIEAFGYLTSLETTIFNATNDAITSVLYRYGSCGCIEATSFVPVVIGEERLNPGQNPTFQVQLAGILSHRKPEIVGKDIKTIHVRNGVATVSGDMGRSQKKTFTGSLIIYNKSGIPKTFPWKKTFYREPTADKK
jgi:hypothetical protein